jgi:hypothetical protein
MVEGEMPPSHWANASAGETFFHPRTHSVLWILVATTFAPAFERLVKSTVANLTLVDRRQHTR